MAKKLEMVFKNTLGTTNKLSVDDARADLTGEEVQVAMSTIVTKNIFDGSGGEFVAVESAQVVDTQITELL